MTTYKDMIGLAMRDLAKDPMFVAVGYNTSKAGGYAAGTLEGVPDDQIIETVLAENAMMGTAIGLSLEGFKSLVWTERFDFALNYLDPLVNLCDKLSDLSNGLHRPAVIIRCAVGNSHQPLYTGPTHTQDFSDALRSMLKMQVIQLRSKADIWSAYILAKTSQDNGHSTVVVEYRDCYAL